MDQLIFIGDLEPYRAQIHTVRARQYRRLLEEADRCETLELPAEHPKASSTYMGIAILNLALAYRLSGNEAYFNQARRVIRTVLGYEKWGNAHLVNVDLSASWILFGLSLGYDWLRPFFSPEESAQILHKIEHHAKIIFDYRQQTYGVGWSTNFYQNHNWINMTGLAAAGYLLHEQKYVQMARENFARVYDLMPEDGSNYEGVAYWRYGGMWLFVYAHLLKMQEGIDYFQTTPYLKNTFYYRLYQSCGDFKQQMNFGDCHDRHSGHPACVYYKAAAEYRDGHAQKLGNMVTEEFLQEEARDSKVKPGILPEAVFEFLWYDPDVAEQDFSDLPTVRFFEDLGLLAMRSSWRRDAKVLTMKCSMPGGRKQWERGWQIFRDEGIDLFSLSHHHPDNLAYIFARGSEYFTCEDGYNRNLMPDQHNVLLVDGRYTDAQDVNDVYMDSVAIRMQAHQGVCSPERYGGYVSGLCVDETLVIYRAETAGVYPEEFQMREVSRLLLTDGLQFWIFADVFTSDCAHTYGIVCNTDHKGKLEDGMYRYSMQTEDILYRVLSDDATQAHQYAQEIVSVMTTQAPDQLCRTSMQTLVTENTVASESALFFEVFTFAGSDAVVHCEGRTLSLTLGEKTYHIVVDAYDALAGKSPVCIQVLEKSGAQKEYRL